jgi:hypothetical protein
MVCPVEAISFPSAACEPLCWRSYHKTLPHFLKKSNGFAKKTQVFLEKNGKIGARGV